MGSAELLSFFSSFPFGGEGWWIYTHLAGGRRSVHCFLDTVHSTPPPIHGPSFSHSVAFSLDRHHAHAHAHTINYILFLSFSLSLPSARTLYLSFFLARFSSLVYSALLFRYSFFLCFFSPLLIIYTHARSCLSFSYSATFKYRIFRNN